MKRNAFKVTVIVAVVAAIGVLASGCSGKENAEGKENAGGSGSSGGGKASAAKIAASPTTDFAYKLNDAGDGVVISKYSGPGGSVVIPATIEGYPVVAIGKNAFGSDSRENQTITSVVIPDSVTEIGEDAFRKLKALTKINLPASLSELGMFAFAGNSELTEVVIHASIAEGQIGIYISEFFGPNDPFSGSIGKLPLATRARLKEIGLTK